MKLYAIKRPDGTVIQAEPSYGESHAWFNAYVFECPSPLNNIEHSKNLGYRCVEVEVAEKAEPGKGRVYEAVTDWIADLAVRDNGAIFWKTTPDDRPCRITYGDLRELLRVAADAEGIVEVGP